MDMGKGMDMGMGIGTPPLPVSFQRHGGCAMCGLLVSFHAVLHAWCIALRIPCRMRGRLGRVLLQPVLALREPERASRTNPPTNIVDFRGFDSSTILILRGGIPRPIVIS